MFMKKISKHLQWALISALVFLLINDGKTQNSMILDQINHSFTSGSQNTPNERLYLQLDKTLYQPGETIWFAGYLREADDLAEPGISEVVHVNVKDKSGRTIQSMQLLNRNGNVQGDIILDAGIPEGDYEITAYTRWQQNGKSPYMFRRDIRVEQLVRPRVMVDVKYNQKNYAGGDQLKAEAVLYDGHHQAIPHAKGECTVEVDGTRTATIPFTTDENGQTEIDASLPSFLPQGGVVLNFSFDHQELLEQVETAVPYSAGIVSLRFFPEGGDLVNGHPARIAFMIRDVNGKAMEAAGYIMDEKGAEVASFETFVNGMGRFEIQPEVNQTYLAVITSPAGIPGTFPLPVALNSGLSLRVDSKSDEKAQVEVFADKEQEIILTANVGNKLCLSEAYAVKAGAQTFEIDLAQFPAGVARFTLFDAAAVPQAERLAFVHLNRQLNVKMDVGKAVFAPSEKVQMDLHISDPQGNPVQGSFSLAVTDDQLLKASGIERSSILAELLLKPELRGHVENAADYFDRSNPNAAAGLDLVLMTHGWRHFTWEELLYDKPLVRKYEAERPVVEGFFYQDTVVNRVEDLKIRVADGAYKVKTDENGYFRLENLDLSDPVTIAYKDVNGQWSEYLVTEYNKKLAIDIATNYEFKKGEESIFKTEEDSQFMASGTASIMGRIVDAETGEPIPFASVQAEMNGRMINGCSADEEGYYTLKPLPPGKIDVLTSSVGHSPYVIRGVLTKSRQIIKLDMEVEKNIAVEEVLNIAESGGEETEGRLQVGLESDDMRLASPLMAFDAYFGEPDTVAPVAVQTATKTRTEEVANTYTLDGIEVVYTEPLVPFDHNISGRTIPKEEFEKLPLRTVTGAASATPGVFSLDGEVGNVRGARDDQTVYYVDGVRVIGDANVPTLGIAEVAVFVGGIPAEYGDCRGGVIEVTTRGPNMLNNYVCVPKKREVISVPLAGVYHKVREFPVFEAEEAEPATGMDLRSTLLWVGNLNTDENGNASVEFTTSEAETEFRITLEGISGGGVPAHAETTFSNRR